MDNVCLRQLLIEVGGMTPWEDMINQRMELDLDLTPHEVSQRVRDHTTLVERGPRIDYDGVDELLGTGSIRFGCPFHGPRSPPALRVPVLETKYIENMHLIHNVIRRYIPIGQQVDVRIKDVHVGLKSAFLLELCRRS